MKWDDGRDFPGGGPAWREGALLAALAALAAALAVDPVPAQEANGYLELIAGRDEVRTEDSTGRTQDRLSDTLLQRYSLDLIWRLYPNFQVVAGGIFERDAVTLEQEPERSRSTQRKIRPYVTAALQTTLYSATAAYYRNQDEIRTGGLASGAVQEIYNSTLGWRPERLPSVLLRFIRTRDFDLDRRIQDSTTDTVDLVSEYQPADSLQLYYRGAREDLDDRLSDLLVRSTSHAGRVTYGDSWWDQRVQAGEMVAIVDLREDPLFQYQEETDPKTGRVRRVPVVDAAGKLEVPEVLGSAAARLSLHALQAHAAEARAACPLTGNPQVPGLAIAGSATAECGAYLAGLKWLPVSVASISVWPMWWMPAAWKAALLIGQVTIAATANGTSCCG